MEEHSNIRTSSNGFHWWRTPSRHPRLMCHVTSTGGVRRTRLPRNTTKSGQEFAGE